jgi:hypothetical protein
MTAEDQQAKAETVVIHDNGAYTTYRVWGRGLVSVTDPIIRIIIVLIVIEPTCSYRIRRLVQIVMKYLHAYAAN